MSVAPSIIGQANPTSRSSIARPRFVSARARVGTTQFIIGCAHFITRRFDEAIAKQLIALQEDPSFPDPYRYLAACYSHAARLDQAREVVNRLRAITPLVVPSASELRNAEHRELYLSGLRLAAGEAT
jgi:adenylate cyclase